VLGTPAYMSPEQIRQEDVDQRTDLFALGATLIEVLSGERIFEGSSYADCVKKILSFNIETLDRFTEQSSDEFVRFLKLLMAPKKKNRFASSKDALQAFDKKDSNIFIAVSQRHSSHQKRLIYILSSVAMLIVAIVLLFPNKASDSKKTIQAESLLNYDSVSVSKTAPSDFIAPKNLHPQIVNESVQKPLATTSNSLSPGVANQPAADSGTVTLTSTPWAKVYVDDKFIGETPFSKPLILAAGKHSVLFVHPSFDPIMQTVVVLPFRENVVTGNFFNTVGYLNCLATPWAEVYINDQYKDTTPLENPIMLSPGKYQVRFKNASFQDIVREVVVRSKDTTSIIVTFKGQ
jgi:serine/threonine protein kinase